MIRKIFLLFLAIMLSSLFTAYAENDLLDKEIIEGKYCGKNPQGILGEKECSVMGKYKLNEDGSIGSSKLSKYCEDKIEKYNKCIEENELKINAEIKEWNRIKSHNPEEERKKKQYVIQQEREDLKIVYIGIIVIVFLLVSRYYFSIMENVKKPKKHIIIMNTFIILSILFIIRILADEGYNELSNMKIERIVYLLFTGRFIIQMIIFKANKKSLILSGKIESEENNSKGGKK